MKTITHALKHNPLGLKTVAADTGKSDDYYKGAADQFVADNKAIKQLLETWKQ